MYHIGGVNIYIEDHTLISRNPLLPKFFSKAFRCSDINSVEAEVKMKRLYGKAGGPLGREFPFTCLLVYLNGGKMVKLAEEEGDNFLLYRSFAQELKKEVVMDNKKARGIRDPKSEGGLLFPDETGLDR